MAGLSNPEAVLASLRIAYRICSTKGVRAAVCLHTPHEGTVGKVQGGVDPGST